MATTAGNSTRGPGWRRSACRSRAGSGSGSLITWPRLASSARSEPAVPAIVLDASAGVEIVLWTEEGSRLAHHVRDADEVAVPDHFHLECAAALRRMELRELTTTEAHTAFDQMLALRVRRVDTAP